MNRVLGAGKTETLINFMCRYVGMALHRPEKADILDELFGASEWRDLPSISDYKRRFDATVKLFSDQLNAKYVRWVVMRGASGTPKYVLFHATNSLRGLQVMKKTMWRVLPDGSCTAYERDRPEQGVLISSERTPDRDVIDLIQHRFGGKRVRLFDDIHPIVDISPFLQKHAHDILDRAIHRGVVRNITEPGRFTRNKNPLLEIPHVLPESLAIPAQDEQTRLFESP